MIIFFLFGFVFLANLSNTKESTVKVAPLSAIDLHIVEFISSDSKGKLMDLFFWLFMDNLPITNPTLEKYI